MATVVDLPPGIDLVTLPVFTTLMGLAITLEGLATTLVDLAAGLTATDFLVDFGLASTANLMSIYFFWRFSWFWELVEQQILLISWGQLLLVLLSLRLAPPFLLVLLSLWVC